MVTVAEKEGSKAASGDNRSGSENAAGDASSLEASPSPLSRIIRLFDVLRCKHRKPKEKLQDEALSRYQRHLELGKSIPERKQKEWYAKCAWWSAGKTKQGNRVFILAPRGPEGERDYPIDMWELLGYALSKMHDVVAVENCPFAVIWVQMNDHQMWPWTMVHFMESLHGKYSRNLEAVHVVHPSWTFRILSLALWGLASDDFWDYYHSHERVEFLDTFIDMKTVKLPKDIHDYDKWLDQEASELNKKQAAKYGGTSLFSEGLPTPNMGGTEEARSENEMKLEELKRLLEKGGKSD
eukprot:TRINITY_DN54010_c0_g1_i1.p1 TRINITY_DN54010_c0_g1~~TRINITY_DN54010_c0_g1_i1.p1  ORF type:complete len:296 (+),score=54.49 TRINITY_DN54010_c0_g1_i1:36-923(+)